jgi:hypothetical protein
MLPPSGTYESRIFYFYHKTADKKRRCRFCGQKGFAIPFLLHAVVEYPVKGNR